jgi:hypothetical protein
MSADLTTLAPRIDPLVRRLATGFEGERLPTLLALERVLVAGGASFHDLADAVLAGAKLPAERNVSTTHHWRSRPTRDAFRMVAELLDCLWLTSWEIDFLRRIGEQLCRGRRLSNKQAAVLQRLWLKCGDHAA